MSRPDGVTGCESDEIGQKMCLGDAVGASDLKCWTLPFFRIAYPVFVLTLNISHIWSMFSTSG